MKNIVIIGAGPAGLTAAYELTKDGGEYNITVLEQTDRIGGISQTVRVGGNRMDIGGHRFFSKDDRVNSWWAEFLPIQGAPSIDDKLLGREKPLSPNGPDPEKTDNVMLVRERVSRIYYKNHFFAYPVTMSWDTIRGMGFLTTTEAGFSYLKALICKRPETSLENFYINRFGKVLYSMFFEGYTEKLWGRHPREISADWGAQRVKGLSISAVLKDIFGKMIPSKKQRNVETSLIEQFVYPKLGPGQLWEMVADKIQSNGGTILMECDVTGFCADETSISKVCYTNKDGKKQCIDADIVLSTMPVKDLVGALCENKPNDSILNYAAQLPYRDFITVGLLVNRLALKNTTDIKTLSDIVPDCWIYVQDTNVKLGRIQIFNNWSPYMVENPQDTVWLGLEYFCTEGDEFWSKSNRDIMELAKKELELIGVISQSEVLSAHCERIKKAYPAYFDGYAHIDEIVSYINGFENLYCIGRGGQHRYNNMDHSMATAFEAVHNIKNNIKDKQNIWSVNTEKEYHERKTDNAKQA